MSSELEVLPRPRELTADQVVARVRLIQQVMAAVMKKDVHYGVIPGTPKPTLYKPGAEQILVTFQIAAGEPKIEDLSTPDAIRYRVTRPGISIASGSFVGSGVGECSSDEEKYRWRKPVCDAEFEETPEDQRRKVWKKIKGEAVQLKQIRTRPADVANTILKMADKRAYVALALQTTAASDCFSQDLEDLPEEIRESVAEGEAAKPPIQQPEKKAEPAASNGEGKISEAQGKRLYAIWKEANRNDADVKAYIKEKYGLDSTRDILRKDYEAIVAWVQGGDAQE